MNADNVHPLRAPDRRIHSKVVAADADVRGLIPGGEKITKPVIFASDAWELAGHPTWKTKVGEQTKLVFAGVPVQWRTAVKEWTLLCLNPALAHQWAPDDAVAHTWPEAQEPALPVTVQSNLKQLRRVLEMMDAHSIHEPNSDEWARVAALMRLPHNRGERRETAVLAPGTLRGRAQQLMSLWSIRTIVGRPTLLGSEPFDGQDTTTLFGSGHAPRKNRRRPHEQVGTCLGFVAWVFDTIAEDVLAHLRWWTTHAVPPGEGPSSQEEGYEAMTGLLHEIADEQGVLPGVVNNSGNLTLAHTPLALFLGESDPNTAYLWGRYAMRRFDPEQLSLDGGNPCSLPITELPRPDGDGSAPWTKRLLNSRDELQWWVSALAYYGLYYLAATCGLRDLDLDCLPRDCLKRETKRRPTGEAYEVATIRGYKQKNRGSALVPTEWKVNERIARVIETLQTLHELLDLEATRHPTTGQPRLFDSRLVTASKRGQRESMHLDLHFTSWLTKGADRLYQQGVISRSLDDIDRLSSSQIRITALQAYAARPLGNALVAQFGQWSTKNVALGYHLDIYKLIHLADPTDAAELQAEHIGRTLERAAESLDTIRGNGVPRLQQTIERNRAALSNPAPLSAARLKTLGKKNPNIEVGPYTICVYTPDGALCGGKGAADFRLCRPYECRNSAMTPAQRARIELRRRLEDGRSAVVQRSADKIAEAMPEIVQEFADVTDDQLVKIIADDLDDYIAEALGLDEEPS